MDDIEFRRAVLADPNTLADDVKQTAENDSSNQAFIADIQTLNNTIEDAMSVDVPADLESKLDLQHLLANEAGQDTPSNMPVKIEAANDSRYWQIAAAACFAFVFGLMVNLTMLQSDPSMGAGEYALKHTYNGLQNVNLVNESLSLDQVNAQLVSYGVEMENDIGDIQYAKSFFCTVNEANVLHLVVKGEAGDISMYILPKENKLGDWNAFSDSRFTGNAMRYSNADMVIVGEQAEPLGRFQSKVENSMKWKI